MRLNETHISEDELILLADGELSAHKTGRVLAHLAACQSCEQRHIELERKLAQIVEAYKQARPKQWDASGPHALLRARLAEEQLRSGVAKQSWFGSFLTARSMAYAAAVALIVVCGFQFTNSRFELDTISSGKPLPDRRFTPGLTRTASLADLCTSDREETVRQVPASLQQQVLREYGIDPEASSKYEIDYLITPGLGGADDVKNLWPEPHANTPWNSFAKDLLEDRLHRMVCEKKIPLEQAQRDISRDWIEAYKKYYQKSETLGHFNTSASHPATSL